MVYGEKRIFISVFVSLNVFEAGWVEMASSSVLWNEKIRRINSNNVMNNFVEEDETGSQTTLL
jgi:hypothetical protein